MLSKPDFTYKNILVNFCRKAQNISFKNDNLVIYDGEEEEMIVQKSCHRLFALWLIGNTNLSTGVLQKSKKFGFSILHTSINFKVIGSWNSPVEGNFLLREKQYGKHHFIIAKHIVANKLSNQLQLLKSIRDKTDVLKTDIDRIKKLIAKIDDANNQQLLSIEGNVARMYFKHWFVNQNWRGRKPRSKINPLNVCMDIGYTLLFNYIECHLHLYGFDVYKGVYHTNFYTRKSLVCDLVEPFRCIIDRCLKNAFNTQQFSTDDFSLVKGQFVLKRAKNGHYTKTMVAAILERKEDIYDYLLHYYRAFIRDKAIEQYPIFII